MDKQITIRMPKELLAKWLAALRSGRIDEKAVSQTTDVLHNGKGGYCCLGVLQVCANGRVQRADKHGEYPSREWLQRFGVEFVEECGRNGEIPYLPPLATSAAEANDEGKTFAEIADAIEACAEGV